MSVLSIKNYTKYYEEFKAVDDLSLEIEAGEICAFIGHNGAGKTTTLKACAGILEFNKDEILIDGMSIKENPLECKKIMAYLPDNPDLYEVLTGVKYLNFVSDVYGVNPEDRKARIKELANLLGVYDNLPQPISTYSHGMKQKLAIISALVHKPKLLMMDEPFVGLDPTATHHLKNFMKELCKEGSAIFFSTHVLEVAEKLCDKVAIIKKGKLVASGTMEEVKGKTSLEDVFLELESQPEAAVNGGSK